MCLVGSAAPLVRRGQVSSYPGHDHVALGKQHLALVVKVREGTPQRAERVQGCLSAQRLVTPRGPAPQLRGVDRLDRCQVLGVDRRIQGPYPVL
jgi:hypothetical protein